MQRMQKEAFSEPPLSDSKQKVLVSMAARKSLSGERLLPIAPKNPTVSKTRTIIVDTVGEGEGGTH